MGEFKFQRVNGPVLEPIPENKWESRAVLNPGTIREGDIIHMLYRAVEGENYSTIGYARLNVMGDILEKFNKPVIYREYEIEQRGCEDPRIVMMDKKYYIFYTGFDGKKLEQGANARVMLAETKDFNTYKKFGLIGPDFQDKDAMIFPERIGGKIAFIHRIVTNIQVALFDDIQHLIEPETGYWNHHLKNIDKFTVLYREKKWEAKKIGAGPPPIQTEAGWLLIYHGVDDSKVYRAGATLLDEKDPYKVIARFPYPILEPETEYEKYGDVNMVVFPEGLVQFDDILWVYYGAADKVIGLATGKISDIIDELWKHKVR